MSPGLQWPRRLGRPARTLAVAVAACLPSASAAAAVPNAGYGGGRASPAAPLTGLRVDQTGRRVTLEGQAIARCAGGAAVDDGLTVRATVSPAGGFRGSSSRSYRVSAAETRTVRLAVGGVLAGRSRAAGSMRMTVLVRRTGRPLLRCATGLQGWQARSATAAALGGQPPRAGATYFGATNQRGRPVPLPFVLALSGDGRSVDATLFRVRRRCIGVRSDDLPNNTPGAAIGPDGSFSILQRYSQRFSDSVEDYTFSVSGRVGADGAGGTLRATSVLRDPRTRRVIGRCDSGPLRWAAVP